MITPAKIYLLLGAIIVIIVGIILAVFSGPAPQQQVTNTGGFPIATSTGTGSQTIYTSGSGTGSSTPMLVVAGVGTTTIAVDDFLHNGVTEPDVENPGNYYLAGSAGYCTKSGVCPQGASTTDFNITYNANAQFFTIALTREPIGTARLEAQAFLEQTLGIEGAAMCSLRYYLGTDIYTNSLYAGKNLGFSFCAGATELPQ